MNISRTHDMDPPAHSQLSCCHLTCYFYGLSVYFFRIVSRDRKRVGERDGMGAGHDDISDSNLGPCGRLPIYGVGPVVSSGYGTPVCYYPDDKIILNVQQPKDHPLGQMDLILMYFYVVFT